MWSCTSVTDGFCLWIRQAGTRLLSIHVDTIHGGEAVLSFDIIGNIVLNHAIDISVNSGAVCYDRIHFCVSEIVSAVPIRLNAKGTHFVLNALSNSACYAVLDWRWVEARHFSAFVVYDYFSSGIGQLVYALGQVEYQSLYTLQSLFKHLMCYKLLLSEALTKKTNKQKNSSYKNVMKQDEKLIYPVEQTKYQIENGLYWNSPPSVLIADERKKKIK